MKLLLRAVGAGWTLEIVGKLPDLPPWIDASPETALVSSGAISFETLDVGTGELKKGVSGEATRPLFFEAVGYDIHFERGDSSAVLVLPPGAEARRVRADSEHHFLNFGNNVGFADIEILTPGGDAKLRIEVFCRKVDYRTDYVAMRTEISEVLRNLAMAANAKTYGLATPAKDLHPTLVEWFALVQGFFTEFVKLANGIARKPHSGLKERDTPVATERARRVSRQVIERSLRRENGGTTIPNLGIALPRRIRENVSTSTFDTPENRYYKALLKLTYRNVRALSKVVCSGDEDADRYSERRYFASIRPTLQSMERQLEAVLRAPFLGKVRDADPVRPASMVFHKHPLYSKFDKLCRLLNGGLSFAADVLPIGVKETALLYEYWCFLKIVVLLRKRFDLIEQSVVKINRFRTTVALSKGISSAARFVHVPTGKPLFLVYNRLFNRLPTIDQKPDNVIQFASESKFYIFDAKYRVQFDRDYVSKYNGAGPTTEDVNTMHRYRDAIAIPHPARSQEYIQGVVSGAVVLFPFPNEEAYRGHKFYKSIGQVEIGGIPFLPNSSTLVDEKLTALLANEYPEAPNKESEN